MERFLRLITPEIRKLVEEKRISEAIYSLEETISWSLVQLSMIWSENFTDLGKAEECLRAAIKISPSCWQLHTNLAHVLNLNNKFEDAKKEALRAIACCDGKYYDPYYNLGVILTNLVDHEGAIENYRIAEKLFCHSGYSRNLASYNISASLLVLKRWKEGWKAYENRFNVFDKIKSISNRFKAHLAAGYKTRGKKIYVYSEQGIGDLIQFSRYLPKLKSSTGAEVICEPQISMHELIRDNFKLEEVVPRVDGIWPEVPEDVDYAVSVCSLPGLFDAGVKPIPNKPYIKAPKRPIPENLKVKGLKVGICWAGNADHANDFKRSIYLSQLEPLFEIKNVTFFSFQKECNERFWCGKSVVLNDIDLPLVDLSSELKDFSDTAFYFDQMDLIITVDTSVVHLAGAMGKKTWLMVDRHNDWRWGLEGDSTVWYPSVKIFRQRELYDWSSVIEEIHKELSELVN